MFDFILKVLLAAAVFLVWTMPDSRGADMPKPHPNATTGGAAQRPQQPVAPGGAGSNSALAIAAGAVVLTVVWRF
jgi:hypothetical protein